MLWHRNTALPLHWGGAKDIDASPEKSAGAFSISRPRTSRDVLKPETLTR
jgi:hypothetical protein